MENLPLGYEVIDRQIYVLLTYDLQHKKLHKIAKRIMIIITNFGIQYLFSLLNHAFDIICGEIQADINIKDIRKILGVIIGQFQCDNGFTSEILKFFDSRSEFPRRTLIFLSFYTSFPLTLIATHSKHSLTAVRFFKNELIPKLSNHNELHIPYTFISFFSDIDIDISSLPNSLFDPIKSENTEEDDESNSKGHELEILENRNVNTISKQNSSSEAELLIIHHDSNQSSATSSSNLKMVSLYSVFNEYFIDGLNVFSNSFLSLFFNSFSSSISLGSFFVHILNDSFNFIDKFDQNFSIFLPYISKTKQFSDLVYEFDIPELSEIKKEENLIFIYRYLSYVYSKTHDEIDLTPLLSNKWKNKDSQFNLVSIIPKIDKIRLRFPDLNNKYKIYWSSPSFLYVISTASNPRDSISILKYSDQKNYSAICLLTLFQIKSQIEHQFNFLCDFLIGPFFKYISDSSIDHDKLELLTELWSIDSKEMVNVCVKYSSQSFAVIFKITPKEFQHCLFESEYVKFSTESAIYASMKKFINFTDFLVNRFENFDEIIQNISYNLDSISDVALNEFFEFSLRNFAEISKSCRNMILNLYQTAKKAKKRCKDFDFSYTIKHATDVLKFEASRRFESFMNSEINVGSLSDIINKQKKTNHNLFEYMIAILLNELQYIESHTKEENHKITQILIELIKREIIDEKQTNNVFSAIISFLSTENLIKYNFAIDFVEMSIKFLGDHTLFASKLLLNDNFLQRSPQLYSKIEETVKTFTFQNFTDFVPCIELPLTIRRFSNISPPPQKKIKSIQPFLSELSLIPKSIDKFLEFSDWISMILIKKYLDMPIIFGTLIRSVMESPRSFENIFVQCCIYRFYSFLNDKDFDKDNSDGFMIRRFSILLGQLIGFFTFNLNNLKHLKYLKLKNLLLYALSNGKLYGVVGFVTSLLMQSSPIFFPPNPFTSSILNLLVSISIIPHLKSNIKNQIELLLMFFNVSLNDFVLSENDNLFPDKTKDNFDFTSNLFNLSLLFSENQMERIILFDQNFYFCFISYCLILPNSINSQNRIRAILSLFSLIKNSSKKLSDLIVSTVSSTILRDLHKSNNSSIFAASKAVTRKLSSSLVIHTCFFDYKTTFVSYLSTNNLQLDDTLQKVIDDNSFWVHQFLSEVTYALSLSIIREKLNKLFWTQHNDISYLMKYEIPNKFLELSVPTFIQSSNQNQFKEVVDVQLFEYLTKLDRICTLEVMKGYKSLRNLPDESYIHSLLKEIPQINSVENALETFCLFFDANSLLLFLETSIHVMHSIFEKTENCHFLDFTCFLLKRFNLPPLVIHELISLNFITINSVDSLFASILDKSSYQLINERQIEMIIKFLSFYLVDFVQYSPNDFIQSLTVASFLPLFKEIQTITKTTTSNLILRNDQIYSQKLGSLKFSHHRFCKDDKSKPNYYSKTFYLLDEILKLHQLFYEFSTQSQQTIDTKIDIYDNVEYSSLFLKWKNAIRTANEAQIISVTKSCSRMPRDFFVSIFEKEDSDDIIRFLRCVDKLCDISTIQQNIYTAISIIIFNHKQHLYQKMFSLIKCLQRIESVNNKSLPFFLHQLRPLKAPDFIYMWIELISDPQFIVDNISTPTNESNSVLTTPSSSANASPLRKSPQKRSFSDNYDNQLINSDNDREITQKFDCSSGYAPLFVDFVACIGFLNDSHDPNIFQHLYKAFLRLLLILSHDFPDFIASIAMTSVSLLPPEFTQLRNIMLSVSPRSIELSLSILPDLKIDHLSDIHQIAFNLLPLELPFDMKKKIENIIILLGSNSPSFSYNISSNSYGYNQPTLLVSNHYQCNNCMSMIYSNNAIFGFDQRYQTQSIRRSIILNDNSTEMTQISAKTYIFDDIHYIIDSYFTHPAFLPVIVEEIFNITVKLDSQTTITQLKTTSAENSPSPIQPSVQRPPFVKSGAFRLVTILISEASNSFVTRLSSCFVDQLRFRCRSTHFFSKMLIELFKLNLQTNEGNSVSEIITVSLLERCSLPPPHPWGLSITIIELFSNKDIGFWEFPFIKPSSIITPDTTQSSLSMNDKVRLFLKSIYYLFCDQNSPK